MLLRKCVEDVRREISRRHIETAKVGISSGSVSQTGKDMARLASAKNVSVPVEAFEQEDRERVLELLLSQERVVTLLYAKVFPPNKPAQGLSKSDDLELLNLDIAHQLQ